MKSGYFIGKWSFQLFFQSWLLCSSLFAQTNLDSIAQLIESTEGKEKAANYALLSWEYRFTDKEKALDAGDAGLAYSRKINDTSGIAGNLNSIAETHLNFGDMELAEKITLDELPFAKALLPKSKYYLGALTRLGTIHYRRGKLDSALHYQLLVQREAEKGQPPEVIGVSAINLGLTYMDLKKNAEALRYFNIALESFKEIGFKAGMGACYVNIAETLRAQKKYREGLSAADEGEKMLLASGNKLHLGYIYSIKADILRSLGDKSGFVKYARKCYDIAVELQDELTIAQGLEKLGRAYLESGNMEQARKMFEESLALAQKIDFPTVILSNYANLRDWHLLQKNFVQANTYEELFQAGRDSVFNAQMAEKVADAQTKYETEKKETEIQRQRAELLNQRLYIFGLLAGLILFILAAYVIYNRYRVRKKAELDAAIIREQQLGLNAVIEAQEGERKRIAKDLHDGIAQELVALKLGFNLLQNKLRRVAPEDAGGLDDLLVQLDNSCQEVRNIAHTMAPPTLEQHGLVPSLELLLNNVAASAGLTYRIEENNWPASLDDKKQTGLYRITQELLNNIIKHARASKVWVRLVRSEQELSLELSDDGIGFDFEQARQKGTMGILNILSRVKMLGGNFVTGRNESGRGMFARISIPNA
ncbi:MAG: sensor histidine kinase [Lewinellaceae bacterium]|nr:sensor histidine kinase [Saprospiraceae bacterium]MCB9333900.1 sensor histidine kinase [Lewinellaceae bacterium]